MEFKDSVIVITGGSKGIGRAVALAFAQQGARVAISARGQADLETAAAEIEAAGGQALAALCDVTDQAQVDAFAAQVQERWSAPRVLVNNAGIAGSHKLINHPDELWERIIAVNLTGAYRVGKAFAPLMAAAGGGRIIMMASVASKQVDKYMSAYASSKHGLIGLMRTMAVELNEYGITVNAICPGYVDTPMTDATVAAMVGRGMKQEDAEAYLANLSPQKRLIQPEEVAALTLLLASHAAAGITGQAINVDGGMAMM